MTNALIIVAHPDDETIWMGGTILKHPEWKWTIMSLCRASDKDREPKFRKVCEYYNAKSIITDLEDDKLEPGSINETLNLIKSNLKVFDYNYIFTHGENGEYGHIRHKEVHQAVKQMITDKILLYKKLYFFNYEKGVNEPFPNLITPKPILNSDLIVKLTEEQFNLKKMIIKDVYGYPNEKGFELLSCNKIETFDVEEFDKK
mgnify:CR=1 FL=1